MTELVEYVDPDRAATDAEPVQQLWTSWAARGDELSTAQWAHPTRLSGWTVRDLYAHAAPEPDELINFLSARAEGRPSGTTGASIRDVLLCNKFAQFAARYDSRRHCYPSEHSAQYRQRRRWASTYLAARR